jgi:hypothetical protein
MRSSCAENENLGLKISCKIHTKDCPIYSKARYKASPWIPEENCDNIGLL